MRTGTASSPPVLTGSALDVYRRAPDGDLDVNLHPFQLAVLDSPARFVAAIAGSQGGKTVIGPVWMHEEMRAMGPGDYLVGSPSYALMNRKALATFLLLFDELLGLGTYHASGNRFVLNRRGEDWFWEAPQDVPTNVYFAHARNASSLESSTLKAAWLDECGQPEFRVDSWEAVVRRLAIFRARALLTTTPYNFGWLKQRVHDPWRAGDKDFEVIGFPSLANPAYSVEEDERARRDLPAWKYQMFHQGRFTRPAGLIYDSFDPDRHGAEPFPIPKTWPRHVGIDFGGVNTAAVFYAENPQTGHLYLYREYLEGGRSAAEHARHIQLGEPPFDSVTGGSASEGQWRHEFRVSGMPVRRPPIKAVEVGIDRVYGCHARDEITVFRSCARYLEQKAIYSRELDDRGEPTEKIEDKESFHLLDAERYAIAHLRSARRADRPKRVKSYAF